MDVRSHNRAAWDLLARSGDRWSVPVDRDTIAAARRGEWSVVLTNNKPVPASWFETHRGGAKEAERSAEAFGMPSANAPRAPRLRGVMPDLTGRDILALASAGGQQGPIFAAAGARVTVLDNSPEQLARDALVAKREGLDTRLVEGTMEDLSAFPDASFDLVFNPISVIFARDVRRVWAEAARVLRPGGVLMAGMVSPVVYLFERAAVDGHAPLVVKHRVPYDDPRDLPPDEREGRIGRREPLEFGHTLADLLGGQLDAGLQITAMYEDVLGDAALDGFIATELATRAVKPPAASAPPAA